MADFEHLIDVAAERLGGRALWASDEFFAPKENLLKPGRGEFIPGKYTENGKWMDGWESRRKRTPGNDWVILKLGLTSVLRGIDVDTNHFLGNAPKEISLQGLNLSGYRPVEELLRMESEWKQLLPASAVKPGSQNLFAMNHPAPLSHLRLNIFPDGGVARFRAYGMVVPDWNRLLSEHSVLDLAAVEHGGEVLGASDEFFSDRRNLIAPGRSVNMGDGWETRRRRGPGYDWVVVKLGRPGLLRRALLDTTHFKGNFPDTCSLEGCHAPDASMEDLSKASWSELLPKTKLEAHTEHAFDLPAAGKVSHVRLNIFPDGGVARLRLLGTVA